MSKKPTDPQQETGRRSNGTFAPGNCANPRGRIPGSRNKATQAALTLLDGEAEALTRKAVDMALEGDTTALRLCLERIIAPCKERALPTLALPTVVDTASLSALTSAILDAVARGDITPCEGEKLAGLAMTHGKVLELQELERRIAALEENHAKD